MEQLKQKRLNFAQAYRTLESASKYYSALSNREYVRLIAVFSEEGIDYDEEVFRARDAMIQRFEYTFEACWKYLKVYVEQENGVLNLTGSKSVVREAVKIRLISEEEGMVMLDMIDKRNLTSHVYRLEVAQQITAAMPSYVALLGKICATREPR